VKITDIEITTHRIDLEPPFHASWDTRPRRSFAATITRVHTGARSGNCKRGAPGVYVGTPVTGH